jgi:hypothetical protein
MTLNYLWEKLLRITHPMLAIANNYQNKYRMSQTQATETVGKDEINARNFLISKPFKSSRGGGYTPDSIEIKTLETAPC